MRILHKTLKKTNSFSTNPIINFLKNFYISICVYIYIYIYMIRNYLTHPNSVLYPVISYKYETHHKKNIIHEIIIRLCEREMNNS